jgi:RNase P subunit RPR2
MNAESSQYTHGFCLNCNKIRPVRSIRIGDDEHGPTNIVCNECNFIIASLYTQPRKI